MSEGFSFLIQISLKQFYIKCQKHFLRHTRGRKHSDVLKIILLFTAGAPPNWTQTLNAGRKAKNAGIVIGIMTREDDAMNQDAFRRLSSGRMMWFGDERDHFKTLNQLIDTGSLCKVMEKPVEVRVIKVPLFFVLTLS